ncbi:glycosyltransferase N-terminal domain-containing protein [Aliiroseovarius subalbicans]|uniref:3-deoxy-D-manno-octulosonic acid transferase n=1 Tax=Aliiroseovarius subalbicans TaxID=2925840 RepID=UPI001F56714E|nr:glycosyltransferase N-terminal domain-containing protein [Aliiroseovarius subalbicans]MCI2400153.1 3-deoxy-D-manno-octulosonic acid transferase [Aliiroseovarius subalbicans]
MRYAPGLQLYLAQQKRRGLAWCETQIRVHKEDPLRIRERLGETSQQRPVGPLIWFHAGGESEAMALSELISRLMLERDDLNFLITTTRHIEKHQQEQILMGQALHQYAPCDTPQTVARFLDHWRPDMAIWVDRELHPALITCVFERQVPMVMIDARMSDEAQQKWRWRPGMARNLLRCFQHILAADGASARNFKRLGFPPENVEVTGFLQEGGAPLNCVQSERDDLAALLAARPVWLGVNVTAKELDVVVDAHRKVVRRSHRLLLLLNPTDLVDGPKIAEDLRADGWIVAVRSQEEEPDQETQIMICDTPGELGLWYHLSPVTFIGQTFYGDDPRNPHEAAALGSAILFGPNPARYRERFNRLEEAHAARRVSTPVKLAYELEHLLAPDKAAALATAAWEVSTAGADVTDRVSRLIFDTLDEVGV